ncbi:hypothetical protein KHS38_13255 [Mucilaginibacter sp. Bleaf8]|uniref:hypothetical protein n=1 Tax=Mucilaginibacter sp. Bleaf8 TaxID=2834430 RepID=UPI001BCB04F1|nr:hypothetical protein [Mucilaginibacter sp. Bleaf8]MBS7565373.1 hypothetical protein [Mucilaginibacter sp. Bleaf8]
MKRISTFIISAFAIFISCKQASNPDQLINQKASLPDHFKLSELHQKVITSFISKKDSTMSILYGNHEAYNALDSNVPSSLSGVSATLVTWRQQDDPHWFGARIPGDLLAVETIKAAGTGKNTVLNYQRYTGKQLVKLADTTGRAGRIKFIMSQQASILP